MLPDDVEVVIARRVCVLVVAEIDRRSEHAYVHHVGARIVAERELVHRIADQPKTLVRRQ